MAEVPVIAYILLLIVVIVSVPMTQIAKYGWRSRLWTGVFAAAGSISMLTLIILVMIG